MFPPKNSQNPVACVAYEALRSAQMNRRAACSLALAIVLSSCAKKKYSKYSPPSSPIPTTEVGLASWYGYPYHGRAAADGEIYDMEKLTAAHRTLPFNTWVRVTNLTNQKTVDVRITDRGPFIAGRIIDLSHAAAEAIDLVGPGVAQVRLDIIPAPVTASAPAHVPPPPPPVMTTAGLFAVDVGAFPEHERAEHIRAILNQQYGSARLVVRDGRPPVWRVLVGSEPSEAAANTLVQKLQADSWNNVLVVRLQ